MWPQIYRSIYAYQIHKSIVLPPRVVLDFSLAAKLALIIAASAPLILVFGVAYALAARAPFKVTDRAQPEGGGWVVN